MHSDGFLYGLLREELQDTFEIRHNERRRTDQRQLINTLWNNSQKYEFRSLTAALPSDFELWTSIDMPGVYCIAPKSQFVMLGSRKGAELMRRVPREYRYSTIQTRQFDMALAMKKGCRVGVLLKQLEPGFKAIGNPLKEMKFGTVDAVHDGLITVRFHTPNSVVSTNYNMHKLREDPMHPLIPPPPECANFLDKPNFCAKHDLHSGERLIIFEGDYTIRGELRWAGQLAPNTEVEVLLVTDEPIYLPQLLFQDYYRLTKANPDYVIRAPMSQAIKERHMEVKNGANLPIYQREVVALHNGLPDRIYPIRNSPQLSTNSNHDVMHSPLELGSFVVGPQFEGYLRWIGPSIREEMTYGGVETLTWQGDNSPGEFEGKIRFQCQPGYSCFVPLYMLSRDGHPERFTHNVDRYQGVRPQDGYPRIDVPRKPPLESSEDDDDDDDDEEDNYRPQQPVVVLDQRQSRSVAAQGAPPKSTPVPTPVISQHRVNVETNALHLYRSINQAAPPPAPIVSRDQLSNALEKVENRTTKHNLRSPSATDPDRRINVKRSPLTNDLNHVVTERPPRALPRRQAEREMNLPPRIWREGQLVRLRNEPQTIGHIRWIGESKDRVPTIGLDLLAPDTRTTAGVFEGQRRFKPKIPSCAMFVPEMEIMEAGDDDHLVAELAELNVVQAAPNRVPHQQNFGHSPTPDIQGTIAPVRSSDYRRVLGRSHGIQGHCNSCYLDSILFSLFTFSSSMDSVLYRDATTDDIEEFSEVQRILREGIVNPLRRRHFVRADKVMSLRELLGQVTHKDDMRYSQKDIEELFNILMEQTLHVEPLIRLNSGEKTNMYQLFLESKDGLPNVPETQTLLELSLACSNVKFLEEPPVLLMMMPRHSADEQLFQKVIPSPEIELSYCVDGYPHMCFNCDRLADIECLQCIYDIDPVPSLKVAYQCHKCCKKYHAREREHRPQSHEVSDQFRRMQEPAPMHLLLVAVLCIRKNHYVSFVRCGNAPTSPWVFFDSMFDKIEGSHCIPMVQEVNVNRWLTGAMDSMRNKRDRLKADLNISTLVDDPSHIDIAERLFSDGYMCIYQSLNACIYR